MVPTPHRDMIVADGTAGADREIHHVLEAMRLQYRARAAPQPVNEVSLAGMCVRHGDRPAICNTDDPRPARQIETDAAGILEHCIMRRSGRR